MLRRRREQRTYIGKGVVGASSANLVQKNNSHKNKKKTPQNQPKTKQTTTFKKKKKKKGACYVRASTEHFVVKCPNHKDNDSGNMAISKPGGTSGYGNSLPTVLSVLCSPE